MSNSAVPTLPNNFDVFAEGAASSVPTTMTGYHSSLTHNSYNLFATPSKNITPAAPVVEGNNSSASNSAATPTLHRSIPNSPESFNKEMKKMMGNNPATPSGNNSSASNSAAAASAPNQYMDMTPRDHFMIKKLEEIMEKRFSIPKDKKVPFPEGLTELAVTLVGRRVKNDTTITNKERADLEKYLLILMGSRESSGGNNSSAASAAPVFVPMTENDKIFLRILKNFIGIEREMSEDKRVPLSSELINLAKILDERKDNRITEEERKTLKDGLDSHAKKVKEKRGTSGGARRKSRKARKSRKTKSRKTKSRR